MSLEMYNIVNLILSYMQIPIPCFDMILPYAYKYSYKTGPTEQGRFMHF